MLVPFHLPNIKYNAIAKSIGPTRLSLKKLQIDLYMLTSLFSSSNMKSLMSALVTKLLSRYGITKDTVTLWGTGAPYREFLYSDDLAKAVIFLMQHYNANNIGTFVNIGTGNDITIKELALMVKNSVEFQGEVIFDASKPDGAPKKQLDISIIKKLGWKHKINLHDGIHKIYYWYNNQKFSYKKGECCGLSI